MGRMSVEQHVDGVPSADLVIHGWDLARATGQDDTIDPDEVARMWPERPGHRRGDAHAGLLRPGHRRVRPGGRPSPDDAPLQDRLLGLLGSQPRLELPLSSSRPTGDTEDVARVTVALAGLTDAERADCSAGCCAC